MMVGGDLEVGVVIEEVGEAEVFGLAHFPFLVFEVLLHLYFTHYPKSRTTSY